MAEIPRKIRREFSGGLDFRIHCVILDERNFLLYPISQGKDGFSGGSLMFNKHDISRDACQLYGPQSKRGYDWWWHSFTGINEKTGKEKSFFVEYFLCNPHYGGDEPVFGQLEKNRESGIRPSYLMVKAGAWGEDAAQIHRFFGWNNIEVSYKTPFSVKAQDCFCTEDRMYGKVKVENAESNSHWMCQNGFVEWDLKINKKVAFNVGYGAGKLFRRIQLFEMFWHAEGMKTEFSGEVNWNGEKYLVSPDTCYGYSDKNWGKDFTSPWVWLSSCNLESRITGEKLGDSVFDIGGGCPKIGPIPLRRKLLSAFWYKGKCYEFNFSKFWTFTRTKFHSKETDTDIIWHVEQKNLLYRMVTDISCKKKDMLLVNYEAPNGKKRHNRLFNGGNGEGSVKLYRGKKLIDDIYCRNVGCEYGEYDC